MLTAWITLAAAITTSLVGQILLKAGASGSVAAWALGFTVSAPHEPDRAARRCARDLLGRLGCLVDGGAGHRARPVNSVDCMFVARVPSLGEDGSDYLSGSLLRMVRDIVRLIAM